MMLGSFFVDRVDLDKYISALFASLALLNFMEYMLSAYKVSRSVGEGCYCRGCQCPPPSMPTKSKRRKGRALLLKTYYQKINIFTTSTSY